jgi:hypothetical protein
MEVGCDMCESVHETIKSLADLAREYERRLAKWGHTKGCNCYDERLRVGNGPPARDPRCSPPERRPDAMSEKVSKDRAIGLALFILRECKDYFVKRDEMNARIHLLPTRLSPITEKGRRKERNDRCAAEKLEVLQRLFARGVAAGREEQRRADAGRVRLAKYGVALPLTGIPSTEAMMFAQKWGDALVEQLAFAIESSK